MTIMDFLVQPIVCVLGRRDLYSFFLRNKTITSSLKALWPVVRFVTLGVYMNVVLHFSTHSFCKFSSAKDGGRRETPHFLAASSTTLSITRKNKGAEINFN